MTAKKGQSGLRAGLSYLRGALLTALAVVIISTAVLVGIGRALIPYADHLRPWLAATLAQRIGEPVRIGRVEADWPRLTPRLSLSKVVVGDSRQPVLELDQAHLEMHLANLVFRERNLFQLIVLGLDLVLAEDAQGRWGIEIEGGARLGERSNQGQAVLGDLLIRDARVEVRPRNGLRINARLEQGELRRQGAQTLIGGRLQPGQVDGSAITFAVLMERSADRWESARAWIRGREINVQNWLQASWLPPGLRVSLEGWAEWSDQHGARVDADVSLTGMDATDTVVAAKIIGERRDRVTQLEVVEATRSGNGKPWLRGLAIASDKNRWAIAVDELELERLFELLSPWLPAHPAVPMRLAGRLTDFEAGWRHNRGLHTLTGGLHGLEFEASSSRLPALAGLSLELGLSGDRPVVEPTSGVRVDWPDLFRETIEIDQLHGRLLLSPHAVEFQAVRLSHARVAGQVDGWVYLGNDSPWLDLVIDSVRIDALDPRVYLPLRYIPAKAFAWLDQSLRAVGAAEGSVFLHMRAGTRSRQIRPGHLQALIDFEDLVLAYWPGWPQVDTLNGQAGFVGSSLSVGINAGRIGEFGIRSGRVDIADLNEPVVMIELDSGPTQSEQISALLKQMPFAIWSKTLSPMAWSGPARIATQIRLPIKRIAEWSLDGQIDLDGASLALPDLGMNTGGLFGSVGFDRTTLGPARLMSAPAESPEQFLLSASLAPPAWLQVDAQVNPARLFPGLGSLASTIDGQAEFALRLNGTDDESLRLRASSSLSGLGLDLPEPFRKPAELAWPFELDWQVGGQGSGGRFGLADWLQVNVVQEDGGSWRAAAGLGAEMPDLPSAAGLRARGWLASLDLTDWWGMWLEKADAATSLDLAGVDVLLSVEKLNAFNVGLSDVDLALMRDERTWRIRLDGTSVGGDVIVPVPLDSGRVVVIDLEHLFLDPIDPLKAGAELEQQPLAAQTSSRNPQSMPPLHLLVEDLRWGGTNLGRARIESHAAANGMEVELIDIGGPDLRFNGNGRWSMDEPGLRSELNGRLSTDNFSGLLTAAGYEGTIKAGQAQFEVDLNWPGGPQDFGWSRLSGSIDLQMTDGSIPEASPGAGRLLGLASLEVLPRRLTLDFRDVFGAGLKFDQIQGRFDLASGFARTDALEVLCPSVNITISGDTDMAARRFDQEVLIEPGLGATLPVIGGLAGGPVGAAAGLVLQTVLDRPLRGLAEARYRVTGSFDEPTIELVAARVSEDAEQHDRSATQPPD